MAIRITYSASVTLEYDQAAPETFRGEIIAANHPQALRRAWAAASKAYPKARPRSLAVVLEIGERKEVPAPLRRRSPDPHPVDVAILGGDPSL